MPTRNGGSARLLISKNAPTLPKNPQPRPKDRSTCRLQRKIRRPAQSGRRLHLLRLPPGSHLRHRRTHPTPEEQKKIDESSPAYLANQRRSNEAAQAAAQQREQQEQQAQQLQQVALRTDVERVPVPVERPKALQAMGADGRPRKGANCAKGCSPANGRACPKALTISRSCSTRHRASRRRRAETQPPPSLRAEASPPSSAKARTHTDSIATLPTQPEPAPLVMGPGSALRLPGPLRPSIRLLLLAFLGCRHRRSRRGRRRRIAQRLAAFLQARVIAGRVHDGRRPGLSDGGGNAECGQREPDR